MTSIEQTELITKEINMGGFASNIDMGLLTPDIDQTDHLKILQNVGGVFDSVSGYYIKGYKGKWILLAGMPITGGLAIVGGGNSFKSTLLHGIQLGMAAMVMATTPYQMFTYDTETNIQEPHLEEFTHIYRILTEHDIIRNGYWRITDGRVVMGNVFYKGLQNFVKEKIKAKRKLMVTTPYLDRDRKSQYKTMAYSGFAIDSFTDFTTDETQDVHDNVELGDSKGRMIFMGQGLSKTRLLASLPKLMADGNIFMGMTAHVGKNNEISSGPSHLPPPKSLSTMRASDKIKGVTERFFFSLGIVYQTMKVIPLLSATKAMLYPLTKWDKHRESGDLNEVTMKVLRSKSSQSGTFFKAMVSQRYGLDIPLSNFHNLKLAKSFGFAGNKQNYQSVFLPDLTLNRMNVRPLLRERTDLARAIELTSDLYWINRLNQMPDNSIAPTPLELYEGMIKAGYCWDKILATRGRHSVNEELNPIEAHSAVDLIYAMRGDMNIPSLKKTKEKSKNVNSRAKGKVPVPS